MEGICYKPINNRISHYRWLSPSLCTQTMLNINEIEHRAKEKRGPCPTAVFVILVYA